MLWQKSRITFSSSKEKLNHYLEECHTEVNSMISISNCTIDYREKNSYGIYYWGKMQTIYHKVEKYFTYFIILQNMMLG